MDRSVHCWDRLPPSTHRMPSSDSNGSSNGHGHPTGNPTNNQQPDETIEAVIYDLDGTLLDTESLSTEAIQAVVGRFGATFTWSVFMCIHTYVYV
jgi:hypothetical protein